MNPDLRYISEGQHFLVFLLVLVALTFVCMAVMVALRFARRGASRFWLGPALIALALLPGAVSVGLAAIALRSVLRGMALTGSGGTAALAAGSAESMTPLLVGLICVAGLTVLGLVLVAAGTSRVEQGAAERGLSLGTLTAPLIVLLTFGLFALLATLISRVNLGAGDPAQVLLLWRGCAFGAAALALGLLVFAAFTAFSAPRGRAPLAVKVVAILSFLLMGAGALLTPTLLYAHMSRLTSIAMTGGAGTRDTAPIDIPPTTDPSSAPPRAPSPQEEPTAEATSAPSTGPSARPRPRPSVTPSPEPEEEEADESPEPPVRRGALRVGGDIPEPRKLRNVQPRYPEIAKQARVQGVVILECTIDSRGRVSDIKVLRGIPLLDAAAIEAVKQWVYEPTRLNGVPVPIIMTVTVNFRLS